MSNDGYKTTDSARPLKGFQPKGAPSAIADVRDIGNMRRQVIYDDGSSRVLTISQTKALVQEAVSTKQKKAMKQTQKPRKDGTVQMQIGGLQKGKTKVYKSKANANKALNRRYGKDS